MPSRKTQVISLDEETEAILTARSVYPNNVSKYIREAIKAYAAPPSDATVAVALADARRRQVAHLRGLVKDFITAIDTTGVESLLSAAYINSLREEVERYD